MQNTIQPYVVPALFTPSPGTATQLVVSDGLSVNVAAQTATYSWALRDANGNQLINGSGNLTTAQYAAWGTTTPDNVYIPQCVAANLGLTLAS